MAADSASTSEETPPISVEPQEMKPKDKVFRLDPAFPVTALSLVINFALGNMVTYGITARPRLAYLSGLLTIPPTLFLCLRDAQKDFENWEKMRYYREKKYPSHILPVKVRYDWSDYEDVMLATRERKLERERAANDKLYERERQ